MGEHATPDWSDSRAHDPRVAGDTTLSHKHEILHNSKLIMLQMIMLVFFQHLIKPHEMLHAHDSRYAAAAERGTRRMRGSTSGPPHCCVPASDHGPSPHRGRRKPCTPLSASTSSEPVP